jgi:hypothetical protein
VIANVICSTSFSPRAFTRGRNGSARRTADLNARLGDRDQGAERRDVERRVGHDHERRRILSQHPGRDLEVVRVDAADRHRAVSVARGRNDLEGATRQRMKRIVDDDRRTMGLLSDSVSTFTST